MVNAALELAKITSEDPHAGLPEPDDLGQIRRRPAALRSDAIEAIETEWKIEQAIAAEECRACGRSAHRQFRRARRSIHTWASRVFANSRGFAGEYRTSSCGLSVCSRWRSENGSMERDYWYTSSRRLAGLESRGVCRAEGRGARAAAAESAKGRDPESSRCLRAAHGAGAAGRSVRCRERVARSTATLRSWPASWARRSRRMR